MSDNRDELDLEGADSVGGEGISKKSSGLGSLLPGILKIAAIGIGSLIFIVTVSVITYRIMSGSGRAQTVQAATEEYQGKRPQLSWFTSIGVIRTRTNDASPSSIVVNVVLGYDIDDKTAQNELTNRLYELKDFVRNFFSTKSAEELKPENEEALKLEMKERLNTSILQESRVREILFQQLDVVEM